MALLHMVCLLLMSYMCFYRRRYVLLVWVVTLFVLDFSQFCMCWYVLTRLWGCVSGFLPHKQYRFHLHQISRNFQKSPQPFSGLNRKCPFAQKLLRFDVCLCVHSLHAVMCSSMFTWYVLFVVWIHKVSVGLYKFEHVLCTCYQVSVGRAESSCVFIWMLYSIVWKHNPWFWAIVLGFGISFDGI